MCQFILKLRGREQKHFPEKQTQANAVSAPPLQSSVTSRKAEKINVNPTYWQSPAPPLSLLSPSTY